MGFNPASIQTSGNLPNLQAIYYEKMAIANLKATTPALTMTKQKPLPIKSGNQIQFYTYNLLASNTQQQAEGTVGNPITESSTKIAATIGQYADYINCSDLSMDVAIDDPGLLENLSNELNYRLALTLNLLTLNTADTANTVDGSVNIQLAVGSFTTANNLRTASQQLAGVNARPLTADGRWGCLIHPNVVRDLYNDTSPNGLTDIYKRTAENVERLLGPISNDDVFEFAGIRFKQTTTVPTTVISSNTYYQTYMFGDDAIFSVFLGNTESGEKNYKLNIQVAPENGTVSDPARMIGGWTSYNVRFTQTLRPGSTMVIRKIQAQSSAS